MNISIVSPVYNDPRIKRSLNSIFSQEEIKDPEVIVVDGNSTDETEDILRSNMDQIDVLIRENDQGVYDAMNKGISQASGDVIGILNADDFYQDEYVLRDVLNRLSVTGADTCYGDLVFVNDNGQPVRYWESGPYRPSQFYFGWMPPHPTFFVRRELYQQYGKFNLDFPIAADYELMLRLLFRYEVSTTYINRVLVRMALGGQSNESIYNILNANMEVYSAWKKNDLRGGYLVPFLKIMRKLPQYIRSPT